MVKPATGGATLPLRDWPELGRRTSWKECWPPSSSPTRSAAMECYRCAVLREQTSEGRQESLNQANKLSRTYAAQAFAARRQLRALLRDCREFESGDTPVIPRLALSRTIGHQPTVRSGWGAGFEPSVSEWRNSVAPPCRRGAATSHTLAEKPPRSSWICSARRAIPSSRSPCGLGRLGRLAPSEQPLRLSAIEFKDAPALHFGIEHVQGSAARVDLVFMGEIGKPFENADQILVPAATQDLHVAGAALRAERPNRVSLSPLSAPARR
jgi:hypothetical protein